MLKIQNWACLQCFFFSSLKTEFVFCVQTVDEFGKPRSQLDVLLLYHQAAALEDPSDKKEELLRVINEAITLMLLKVDTPVCHDYKFVLMRQALSQLFDDIARAEYQLRAHLHLLEDERFTHLSNFLVEPPPPEVVDPTSKKEKEKQAKARHWSRRSSEVVGYSGAAATTPSYNAPMWLEHKGKLYMEHLFRLVYMQLDHCLVNLLPLITYDGYILNPILWKQKKEERYVLNPISRKLKKEEQKA
jgi:hypothetical protein